MESRIKFIKFMVNEALPKLATKHRWPVTENHCFLRIAYDNLFGRPWKEVLNSKKPALHQLNEDQVEQVIEILKRFPDEIDKLNRKSLRLRMISRINALSPSLALPKDGHGG